MDKSPKNPIALEERGADEGRLYSPSAGRNKDVIAEALAEVLPETARVLEIASGTGEHGMALLAARPDAYWQFSDPDPASRQSQSAWIKSLGLKLPEPLDLNMTDPETDIAGQNFDAMFCANMIHIAPWEATLGLALLAERALTVRGKVCLYGPYKLGAQTAPSNMDFDRSLKSRDSRWGVRDLESVKHIFAKHGFNDVTRREMPKNNLFLTFSR